MTMISVIDWTTLVHEYEHSNVTTVIIIISHLPYVVNTSKFDCLFLNNTVPIIEPLYTRNEVEVVW